MYQCTCIYLYTFIETHLTNFVHTYLPFAMPFCLIDKDIPKGRYVWCGRCPISLSLQADAFALKTLGSPEPLGVLSVDYQTPIVLFQNYVSIHTYIYICKLYIYICSDIFYVYIYISA